MSSHAAKIMFFSFDDEDEGLLDTDHDDLDLHDLTDEEDDFPEDEDEEDFDEGGNPWEYDDRDDF